MKSQIPNRKFKINPKSQTPISKQFRKLVIGLWILFVIWYLALGIYSGSSRDSVFAQVTREFVNLNDKINTAKEELTDIKKQVANYEKEIAKAKQQTFSLEREIAVLNNHIAKTKLDIRAAEIEIEQLTYEIEVIEMEIDAKQKKIEKQKQILAELIRKIYKYDQKNQLEILLLNDSFSEFFDQIKYLENTESNLASSLNNLKSLRAELEAKQTELKDKKDSTQKTHEALEKQKIKLESAVAAKAVLIGETLSSESKFQGLVFELRREQRHIDEEIAELEGAIKQKLSEMDGIPEGGAVILTWPVPNKGITAYFHDPDYPFRYIFEHPAIDIRASQGTPIKVPSPGYVLRTRDGGYGYSYVVIMHTSGISTVYGHVSKILVQEGTYVSRDQVIALSGGMSGTRGAGRLTTGPHLHFEVRLNGIPVNPLDYLFSY